MTDCSVDAGLRALHGLCEYSNATCLLAGFYGLAAFPGWWKLVGVYVLVIAVVSIFHHSNEHIGLGAKVWSRLDVTLANTGLIGGLAALVALWTGKLGKTQPDPRLVAATLIVGVIGIFTFVLSEVADRKVGGHHDPTVGYFGPLLAQRTGPAENGPCVRYQIDYLATHATWHMVSGIAIGLWVLTVQPCL